MAPNGAGRVLTRRLQCDELDLVARAGRHEDLVGAAHVTLLDAELGEALAQLGQALDLEVARDGARLVARDLGGLELAVVDQPRDVVGELLGDGRLAIADAVVIRQARDDDERRSPKVSATLRSFVFS